MKTLNTVPHRACDPRQSQRPALATTRAERRARTNVARAGLLVLASAAACSGYDSDAGHSAGTSQNEAADEQFVDADEPGNPDSVSGTIYSAVDDLERAPTEELDQGVLLHEIRLSDSRITRFTELEPGEVVVTHTGLKHDTRPTAEELALAPSDLVLYLTGETAPEALIAAEARLKAARERRLEYRQVPTAGADTPGGQRPIERGVSANKGQRFFLGSSWWATNFCGTSGYTTQVTIGSSLYFPHVQCWSNSMSYVASGVLGDTFDYVASYAGKTSKVTYKHFWRSCSTFGWFTDCSWKSASHTIPEDTWAIATYSGIQARAGELHTPNSAGGGYFSLKYYNLQP